VETLEAFGVIGGEAKGVPLVAEAQFRVGEVAAERVGGLVDELMHRAPEDVADLALGGGGGEDDGAGPGEAEPGDEGGGKEGLARGMAGAYGDSGMVL